MFAFLVRLLISFFIFHSFSNLFMSYLFLWLTSYLPIFKLENSLSPSFTLLYHFFFVLPWTFLMKRLQNIQRQRIVNIIFPKLLSFLAQVFFQLSPWENYQMERWMVILDYPLLSKLFTSWGLLLSSLSKKISEIFVIKFM